MEDLKYFEILAKKKELSKQNSSSPLKFMILSNITVNQLTDIAEYYLLTKGVNVVFDTGNYDNIVQDIQNLQNIDGIIIFWEAANIINGLHYKINLFSDKEYTQILEKVKSEIDLILPKLENIPTVIFNEFSSLLFNSFFRKKNKFDQLCDDLNNYLIEKLPKSVVKTDLNKIIAQVSVEKSHNSRDYISSKVLYSVDFLKAYTQFITPVIMSSVGKIKKALIFDCDNTLWKGVVGEDGFEGINMSENDKQGKPFNEVQNLATELSKHGVIIGLCSKNNPEDVDNVIQNHSDMILNDKYITIKKVNWKNKAENLREIATDLNLGIDSLVFVDDSDFEINLIKEQVPEITTVQVPKKLHIYPAEIRKKFSLFFKNVITEEDKRKTEMYANQVKRKTALAKAGNFEDYLKSLEMFVTVFINDKTKVARIAQMTQKTNQFNLTTKRYTESQILNFVENPIYNIFAVSVADKFGDNGITGLAIIKNNNDFAEIDTFLMSCRIIGRNIEFKFLEFIIDKTECEIIKSTYIKTKKNAQTENFFEKSGFILDNKNDDTKFYILQKQNIQKQSLDYIEISYGK
ncbi:MAG: HAD-IIIC family phosphatase [Chlorobi bacterium]|nr:HAD-IIIC family phosphatase [Chlorobiota bacterium]